MEKLRVLFVGNSHTYFNDMPMIFKKLAEAGQDVEVEVTMQAHPGVTYEWHRNQGSEIRFALVHGNYNYMIMQQAAHSPCPSKEQTIEDGKWIIEKAKECGVTPILCMPWAEKYWPEHQIEMYDIYQTLAKEANVRYTATGFVFDRVLKEHPEINLYFYDGEHCNPYGSYVRAASVYAAIFDQSPEGLPARSIQHYIFPEEDGLRLGKVLEELRADPENEKLQAERTELYGKIKPNWDKKSVWVDLNPEKVATLQKLIWVETQKNIL